MDDMCRCQNQTRRFRYTIIVSVEIIPNYAGSTHFIVNSQSEANFLVRHLGWIAKAVDGQTT